MNTSWRTLCSNSPLPESQSTQILSRLYRISARARPHPFSGWKPRALRLGGWKWGEAGLAGLPRLVLPVPLHQHTSPLAGQDRMVKQPFPPLFPLAPGPGGHHRIHIPHSHGQPPPSLSFLPQKPRSWAQLCSLEPTHDTAPWIFRPDLYGAVRVSMPNLKTLRASAGFSVFLLGYLPQKSETSG